MKRTSLSKFFLVSPIVILLSAGGCGKVLEYPEPEHEQDAARCQDGIDNDFDGEIDCTDGDCNGFCSEETLAECSDGRDNDGDDLTDAADPRCWLVKPPRAQRCAQAGGAEIISHFDVKPYLAGPDLLTGAEYTAWTFWGYDVKTPIVGWASHAGPERTDLLLTFDGNTTGAASLGANLGSYVFQRPFAGSWQDAALAYSAAVPAHTILRAGIVPVGLAPSSSAPPSGTVDALLAVTLDAFNSPPTFSLDVEGSNYAVPLPRAKSGCDSTPSEECWGRVTVTLDSEGFQALYTGPNGDVVEVRAPPPSSLSLPPSRLVLWGGSVEGRPGARLDDLSLSVKPEQPCGFAVPQIPGQECGVAGLVLPAQVPGYEASIYGYTVSTARGMDGTYGALAVAATWNIEANRLNPPDTLSFWTSLDGEHWTWAPLLPLPEPGATLIGAGLAADANGWHAAVAFHPKAGDAAELTFIDTDDQDWAPGVERVPLPDDAEAPSYVITGDRHEVYFTRPPRGAEQRTLWRILRGAPDAAPERIAELSIGTEAPVSIQRVGVSDLVLAAPSRAGSGGRGVALFVADAGLERWQPVGSGPVLSAPPSLDLSYGVGKLAFDDREIVSAALSVDGDRGFFLYGGRMWEGEIGETGGTPILRVGTARFLVAGQTAPDTAVVPTDPCGDGTCDDSEDCVRCKADCPCDGTPILSDAFTSSKPWELVSSDPNPVKVQYLGVNPPGLTWAGGAATWSLLALEQPLAGDFEFSFDVFIEHTDFVGGPVYVGVGTKPIASDVPFSGTQGPESGFFARVGHCQGLPYVTPMALAEGVASHGSADCWGPNSQYEGTWQHVVLRREGNLVTLRLPAFAWLSVAQRIPMCSTAETSVAYTGAMPALTHLLIGQGGEYFEAAPPDATSGTIANLTLRTLDDPEHCPETKQRCDTGSGAATCVDTSRSAEHCGACGQRCEQREVCQDGECTCAESPDIAACGKSCVNLSSSLEHCGSCNHECKERCVGGLCDPLITGDCASPFEIPPEGGDLVLGFPPTTAGAVPFCADPAYGESAVVSQIVGEWTPSVSGTAIIDVDVGEQDPSRLPLLDSVLGFTQDSSCETWSACNDDSVPYEQVGSHLEVPVTAGTTYRIALGVWDYRPPDFQTAVLRVHVE